MNHKKDIALAAKEMRHVPNWQPATEIALHWLVLLGIISAAVRVDEIWAYLLVMPVIGALQYALLILLHDAQHSLLHRSRRVNNLLAVWTIAAPCMTEFGRSQKRHLAHHQFIAQPDKDPDYPLYATQAPFAKDSVWRLALHFVRRVTGQKFAGSVAEEKTHGGWLPVIAMQCCIFLMFALFAEWYFYFFLWLMPLAGFAVFFNDIRIFCEHSNVGHAPINKDNIIITYRSNWLERFFIAPNHMNYHAEHHLFPHVPHSRLPKLRALIQETPELAAAIQFRGSYLGHVLSYIKNLKHL